MSATTRNTQEVPIRIQDRRRYSFYMVDNEIIDDYARYIGVYALSVYNVLSRFSNQDGECFPSLATIAKKLGISKPSVIKALDTLEAHGLIAKERRHNSKGEHISNLYVLLEVEKEQAAPIEVVNVVDKGSKQDSLGGGKSRLPGSKQRLPKQDRPSNKIQDEQDTDVVVALVELGLSEKVAQYLAGQYNADRITEKIGFLSFLEAQYPEQVKNPCGWLRTAIVDDYGKPDGFVPIHELERLEVEETQRELDRTTQIRNHQEHLEQERQSLILQLRNEYGTTEEDMTFWEEAQREINNSMVSGMAALVKDAEILRLQDGRVVLGVERAVDYRQLQHPGTQKAISRALAFVAGSDVSLEIVSLQGL